MKTCSLFNVPQEVARETILSMKDYIIKRIKNDNFTDLDGLVWRLQDMQKAYEEMMNQEDEE